MYGQERRSFAPVKVGEELTVKIEAVGEKGDGIAKVKGFVIFVPNTKQGEDVKIRVTKVLKKVAFAEVAGAASEESSSASDEGGEEGMDEESEVEEEVAEESEEQQ